MNSFPVLNRDTTLFRLMHTDVEESRIQKMFETFGGLEYDLPVTDWLTERVISLPMHPELDEEQLQYITQAVLDFLNNETKAQITRIKNQIKLKSGI